MPRKKGCNHGSPFFIRFFLEKESKQTSQQRNILLCILKDKIEIQNQDSGYENKSNDRKEEGILLISSLGFVPAGKDAGKSQEEKRNKRN